jgi:deoxyribose-phosphate aldolase
MFDICNRTSLLFIIRTRYGAATACIKPYCIPVAKEILIGTDVGICPVIGFPAGHSTIKVKVFEATEAVREV